MNRVRQNPNYIKDTITYRPIMIEKVNQII